MMRWGNSGQAADSFYQVRPDCSQNVPSTKFKIKVSICFFASFGWLVVGSWVDLA